MGTGLLAGGGRPIVHEQLSGGDDGSRSSEDTKQKLLELENSQKSAWEEREKLSLALEIRQLSLEMHTRKLPQLIKIAVSVTVFDFSNSEQSLISFDQNL